MNPLPVDVFRELFNRHEHQRFLYMSFFAKDAAGDKEGRLVQPFLGRYPRQVENLRVAVFERGEQRGRLVPSPHPIRPNGMTVALLYHRMRQGGKVDKEFLCFQWDYAKGIFFPYAGTYLKKPAVERVLPPIKRALYIHEERAKES